MGFPVPTQTGEIRMNAITLKAYAKINLSIDVLRKRDDGYHEVEMIMQQVDLWDQVTVSVSHGFSPKAITITTDSKNLPVDRRNLAYRAAEQILSGYRHIESGNIQIHLNKNIPEGAGLAGGSADAAAVLHALNYLLDLRLSLIELMKIGVNLGADVPFCIIGQAALDPRLGFKSEPVSTCALATGIGEKLSPLPSIDARVILSKPSVTISTAEIYGALRLEDITERPDNKAIIQGLIEKNFDKVSENMSNVLERISEIRYPSIMYTKNMMKTIEGSYKVLMSGSGPTVYAISTDRAVAEKIYQKIKQINPESILTKTL